MSTVVFRNKTGGSETLPAAPGQSLLDVMRVHGIPGNAVLAYRNGQLVPESTVVVEPGDVIELRQVRHYDLDVVRRPKDHTYATPDPVYTKSILFDHGGTLERRTEQLTADSFVEYVEETFVQSIASGGTMRGGDRIVIGLSGGRDSVAYLKLLERTRGRWPAIDMTAVTITGLPDWEEPATFQAALDACAGLGIGHVIVTAEEVAELFQLREPFVDLMNRVVAGEHRNMNMVIGHQVLRRMLEREAGRTGANVVAFGFNADDLVASMVTWFTTGYRMGGIPVRELGGMRYVFPLYRITKKELTLYLELVAPELNRQEPRPVHHRSGRALAGLRHGRPPLRPVARHRLLRVQRLRERAAVAAARGGGSLPQLRWHVRADGGRPQPRRAVRRLRVPRPPGGAAERRGMTSPGTGTSSPKPSGPWPGTSTPRSGRSRRRSTWPPCWTQRPRAVASSTWAAEPAGTPSPWPHGGSGSPGST
ncbi:hypothetical protein ACFQZC_27695 [Streptacidiphilus monticola]